MHESAFPKEIDGICVDVREGCFKTYMYQEGAGDCPEYHKNLSMGCYITNNYQMSGSLGGFIRLPNKSIGCLTCKSRMELEKDILARTDFKRDVFQPGPSLEHNSKFGEVICRINREGKEKEVGVDVALIEITEKHREPRNICLLGGNSFLCYSFVNYKVIPIKTS